VIPLIPVIRPPLTATGRAVLGGALAGYAAGVALGYPELVAVSASGLALLLLASVAVLLRPRLAISRQVRPARVTAGEPVLGRLEVQNASRWPSPSFVAVDRLGADAIELPVAAVRGRGQRVQHYPIPTRRRGRFALGPVTVERRDALGLLRRAQPHGHEEALWVHPRAHTMAALPVGMLLDQEGPLAENAPKGSVTFSSLREYVPGDDPRQVHWKSTARTGTLMVKEHVDTSRPTTTVLLDTRAGLWSDPAGFEDAVEIAASVVVAAQRQRRPVALHLLGEDRAAVERSGATSPLDRLAAIGTSADSDPTRVVAAAEAAQPGGALVVVTGAAEPVAVTQLAGQRRRFAPVVLVEIVPRPPARAGRHASRAPAAAVSTTRRSGMAVIRATTAPDAAAAWNQLLLGGRPR
jgi:uncharacterized protein (DUF58 family)